MLEGNGNLSRREYTPAADGLCLFSEEGKWAVGIVDVFVTIQFVEWRRMWAALLTAIAVVQ